MGSFGTRGGLAVGGDKQLTGTKQGSIFFDAFLTYPEMDISQYKNFTTANDRIESFLSSNHIRPLSIRIYNYLENRLHLSYMDKGNGKLKIIEFYK